MFASIGLEALSVKVAMLLHKSVERDSRVLREARALAAEGHRVTVLHLPRARGEGDGPVDGFEVRSVTPRPAWRRLPFALYRVAFLAAFVRALRRLGPDVVHAHDAAMLAPGWAGARLTGAALVYDSHEYAAGVPYRGRAWALLVTALERALIRRCAAVVTVSDGIATRLRERYALARTPTVVRNVPDVGAAPPPRESLRARLGIGDAPVVLHQGAIAPGRGCEQLVRALGAVPQAQLVFLGDAWDGERLPLRELAARAGVADRVHLVPSVPIAELAACTGEATVGVSLLADSCDNHRLALPNKVFEYIAAGVPVVASDLPELRALVRSYGIGWLADPADPDDIARALRAAIAGDEAVAGRVEVARRELTWSTERRRLTDLYRDLDERRRRRALSGHYRDLDGRSPAQVRPRAVVLVRNGVSHDARIQREARLLDELGYEVLILGAATAHAPAGDDRLGGIAVRRLAPRHLGRRVATLDWHRRAIGQLLSERPALVHCNDYNTMWAGVAAKLACGARVVYDSHELWPDRNLRSEWRPWLLACEALFVGVADRTITTSPGYARTIARRYRTRRPAVVRNVPEPCRTTAPRVDEGGGSNRARPHAALAGSTRAASLAVYFGALTPGRGIERMIAALTRHEELELRLVGPDAWGFRDTLDALARRDGVRHRVDLRDPVPPWERDDVLADADVGLALIEPVCLSYRLTLPNKLFEYAAAGLPVLATDLPEIAAHVRESGAGVVVDCDDDASLDAALLVALDPPTNARLRVAARRAARATTWAAESERLAAVYRAADPRCPG